MEESTAMKLALEFREKLEKAKKKSEQLEEERARLNAIQEAAWELFIRRELSPKDACSGAEAFIDYMDRYFSEKTEQIKLKYSREENIHE